MDKDLIYQIALTLVPQIGDVHAASLLQHFNSAEEIFSAGRSTLDKIPGIGPIRSKSIKTFNDFSKAEKELEFSRKYCIQVIHRQHPAYPKRLLHCYDAPSLLYYKGNADLNTTRILAIIGTRSHTGYGKEITNQIIRELASSKVLIVSGLAYGIDAIAHKASLDNGMQTIGVIAHGLDRIYPTAHTALARSMTQSGGLLTDLRSGTAPDKQNFPRRNRIVAGIADAVLVIETDIKGGSMITAELANNYNKDVFAVPGKVTDAKSAGCNYLIRNNKAALATSGKDILEFMNWSNTAISKTIHQKKLFVDLSPEEKMITEILGENTSVHIDEINLRCGLSSSSIAAAMLHLELEGIITTLPGKHYKLS
ncbi:MAG: DNA-protecting protein DprA [Bacteroidetes bacterium]|nr:DNA-protecting protein DprA [Bacteroidota bacterium]